jgi:hypothetical protein
MRVNAVSLAVVILVIYLLPIGIPAVISAFHYFAAGQPVNASA